jgi:hypothetical protein
MSSPDFILTKSPSEIDDIPLASLVPDRSSPTTDLKIPYRVKEEEFSKNLDKNFDGTIRSTSENWFQLSISRWLSAILKAERSSTFHVSAEKGFIYMLRQPKAVFKQAVASDDVKEWLEEGYLDKQDTWFVIGLRTFINARLYQERRKDVEASGKSKIPGSELAGDPTGAVDVVAAGGHKGLEEVKGGTETTGERIYAICYRRVKITCHNQKVEAKLLKGNRWQPFAAIRGGKEEVDEYYEADLDEQDDFQGLEIESGNDREGQTVAFGFPEGL